MNGRFVVTSDLELELIQDRLHLPKRMLRNTPSVMVLYSSSLELERGIFVVEYRTSRNL